jgi:hypothetical protein
MRSKSIVPFCREQESSPPGRSMLSTALDREFRGRQERCQGLLFCRRFSSQLPSFSRFECLRNRLTITSNREVAYAAA